MSNKLRAVGLQPVSRSLLQTEVERYEQSIGLSCEDIPKLYDASNLQAGSMIKANEKTTLVNSKRPDMPIYSTTKILNDIKTTETGTLFTIDMLSEQPMVKASFAQKMLGVVVYLFSPLGQLAVMETLESNLQWEKEIRTETKYESPARISRVICPDESKEPGTKIIDFQLISQEDLIIAGSTIPSKVYQLNKISKMYGFIRNSSSKVWISDKIPFGIVKVDDKSLLIQEINNDVFMREIIYSFEVTEFAY